MSVTTSATRVGPSTDHARALLGPLRPTEQPALLDGVGDITVLRRRTTIALGSLADRQPSPGGRLVQAHDLDDAPWWVPAVSVWSDAEERPHPEHPWHAGLAHDRAWSRAVLRGLSDRLGWEAARAVDSGATLECLSGVGPVGASVVYDGRLGHPVPCVVIESDQATRWGAGTTVEAACRRALYGDQGLSDNELARELADLRLVLGTSGLEVAVVDVGTALLRQAEVFRVSVQLMGR